MFKLLNVKFYPDPICSNVAEVKKEDFLYYDKDGFELNVAEQKYYLSSGFELFNCLNHICHQQNWFELEHDSLILDHSLILTRASYKEQALEQLLFLKESIPQASSLINTIQKWGFDFALDAVDKNGNVFEVLHVEYDNREYEEFLNQLASFSYKVYNTDWVDAANKVELKKDDWNRLKGFDQNNWKASYLIGWNKAEYTDKTS